MHIYSVSATSSKRLFTKYTFYDIVIYCSATEFSPLEDKMQKYALWTEPVRSAEHTWCLNKVDTTDGRPVILPNPTHSPGECQLVNDFAWTVGMAATGLADYDYTDMDRQHDEVSRLEQLVDDYFRDNPQGMAVMGMYTPRGRKRRGLSRRPVRMLSVRLGTQRHYFPHLTSMTRQPVIITHDRIVVRCRCTGWRPNTPHMTTLWTRREDA